MEKCNGKGCLYAMDCERHSKHKLSPFTGIYIDETTCSRCKCTFGAFIAEQSDKFVKIKGMK